MAIPVIGQLMILVWAFTSQNQPRQNFFRAVIAWIVTLAAVGVVMSWFCL